MNCCKPYKKTIVLPISLLTAISTFSNTTQWEYHIAFIFLKSLSLVLQLCIPFLKSSITLVLYVLTYPPLYWNIWKVTKFCCPGTECPDYTTSILCCFSFLLLFALEASQSGQIAHGSLLKVKGQIPMKPQQIFIHLMWLGSRTCHYFKWKRKNIA